MLKITENLPDMDDELILQCPSCMANNIISVMRKDIAAGIPDLIIDTCPRCGGIFFDNGEVEKMRNHDSGVFEYLFKKKLKHRKEGE